MHMKGDAMNNGQTKPGYNVQISTENQYIVNYDLYWRPTDYGTLIPFLQSFRDKFGIHSSEIVADSGYGSEQNYEFMFANGMSPYVKYNISGIGNTNTTASRGGRLFILLQLIFLLYL